MYIQSKFNSEHKNDYGIKQLCVAEPSSGNASRITWCGGRQIY